MENNLRLGLVFLLTDNNHTLNWVVQVNHRKKTKQFVEEYLIQKQLQIVIGLSVCC